MGLKPLLNRLERQNIGPNLYSELLTSCEMSAGKTSLRAGNVSRNVFFDQKISLYLLRFTPIFLYFYQETSFLKFINCIDNTQSHNFQKEGHLRPHAGVMFQFTARAPALSVTHPK